MEPAAGVADDGGGDEEYKVQANLLKDEGNELFQAGKIQAAIVAFTKAIDLDPDNHVFYSNRCAAYMKSDSKSKALHDAEKCIELAPTWSKGYTRLGAAQQSLKRFDNAIDTFKKGENSVPEEIFVAGCFMSYNCLKILNIYTSILYILMYCFSLFFMHFFTLCDLIDSLFPPHFYLLHCTSLHSTSHHCFTHHCSTLFCLILRYNRN